MNEAETLPPRCPICNREVDPDDPSTVEGIELQDHPGFGQAHDYVEGWHYRFHPACFPDGSPNWRRAD
jgi:hypothetical protein